MLRYYVRVDGIQLLTIAEQIFSIAAGAVIIVGGVSAIQGFSRRLEPKVTGEVFRKGNSIYLAVNSEVRNVGLRRVAIDHGVLHVRALNPSGTIDTPSDDSSDEDPPSWDIFEDQEVIDGSESATDSRLIEIPEDREIVALELWLYVVIQRSKTLWQAKGIVTSEPE